MIKNKAFVFRIFPNETQKQFFEQTFGNVRYYYNNFIFNNYNELAGRDIKYDKIPQPAKLKQDHPFLKLGDSLALCNAQINLKRALKKANSFEIIIGKNNKIKRIKENKNNLSAKIIVKKLKKAERYGLPNFKFKDDMQSYTTNNQFSKSGVPSIKLENDYLFLPKIKQGIKIVRHKSISSNMTIKSVTITKSYGNFYEASILVEYQSNVRLLPIENITLDKVEGLDFSVPEKFINSFGEKANSQNYYTLNEKRIAFLNRKIKRNKNISDTIFTGDKEKEYKGKNSAKLRNKLNKIHYKVKMSRKQENHILANELLNKYDLIVLEDIDLRGMSQCFNFGKSIYDKGFGQLRNILSYKSQNLGKYVIKVDKFFPSSKLCSNCGHKNDKLNLKDRVYECPNCFNEIPRDQNAGINLKYEGLRILQEMHQGVYAPRKKDPNKNMYKLITGSNTQIAPVSISCNC